MTVNLCMTYNYMLMLVSMTLTLSLTLKTFVKLLVSLFYAVKGKHVLEDEKIKHHFGHLLYIKTVAKLVSVRPSVRPCLHGLQAEATLCALRASADERLHPASGPSRKRGSKVSASLL